VGSFRVVEVNVEYSNSRLLQVPQCSKCLCGEGEGACYNLHSAGGQVGICCRCHIHHYESLDAS
jgi:hypothetical protein